MPSLQPLPYPSNDGVSNGGRLRDRCGTPATANPHCPNQACYKLHETTTELPKQLEEDGRVPSYPNHGGLNSDEDTPMAAVAGMVNAPLPKLKRLS